MKTKQTCGNCSYFDDLGSAGGDCHANPPVIIESLIDKATYSGEPLICQSRRPNVDHSDLACRFFVEGGAA